MRLVRYLSVLIVVLSTSAWAAPTQAELPVTWTQAALHARLIIERDLRVSLAHCDLAVQGAAALVCDTWSARFDRDGCGQGPACRQWTANGAGSSDRIGIAPGMPGAWSTRGQIKVVFSNGSRHEDQLHASATQCAADLADVPAGIQPHPRDCMG